MSRVKGLFLFVAFVFVFLSPCGISASPGDGAGLPIYEEIYSSKTFLHEIIREIDYAIHEALHKRGIREEEVFFLEGRPSEEDGHVWDFIRILIECEDPRSALQLEETLSVNIKALDPGISLCKRRGPNHILMIRVFLYEWLTHEISIQSKQNRPRVKEIRPKIGFIIDDLGYDLDMATAFIELDFPVTFSVLPRAPHTGSTAKAARGVGWEVMLHLPMEPKNYPAVLPGPGALFRSMNENEIRQTIGRDLREIPEVAGVNNHMGSSFTEDRKKMLIVLRELKKRGLFFIDSRTTSGTVALDLAREIGLPAARRGVFLDNALAPRALKIQMERLMSMARHQGKAIGIGHPHKETLFMLKAYKNNLIKNFNIVNVSDLVTIH